MRSRAFVIALAALCAALALFAASASSAVLWTGDMEEGSMVDWYFPSTGPFGNYGGGEFNDGPCCTSQAVSFRHHTGSWAAQMQLAQGVGGVRLFRWAELRANRTTTSTAWLLIPKDFDLIRGGWLNIDEYKSRTADNSRNDPFWYIVVLEGSDGTPHAHLRWGAFAAGVSGPHQGELGWRDYGDVQLPIGRWFQVKTQITQSNAYGGSISAWLDGQLLSTQTSVKTGYADCNSNSWCVEQDWALTNYADTTSYDGVNPATNFRVFADDAMVSAP